MDCCIVGFVRQVYELQVSKIIVVYHHCYHNAPKQNKTVIFKSSKIQPNLFKNMQSKI